MYALIGRLISSFITWACDCPFVHPTISPETLNEHIPWSQIYARPENEYNDGDLIKSLEVFKAS